MNKDKINIKTKHNKPPNTNMKKGDEKLKKEDIKNFKQTTCESDEFIEDSELQTEQNVNLSQDVIYYIELAQRVKADFDNFKKRNEDVAKTSYNNGVSFAVESLLPVIDGITQAKLGIKDEATLKGFEIINTQFLKSLENIGVNKIECVGKPFDPNFHNAVMTVSKEDLQDGVVAEEFQQGFMLKDKVIRYSVVSINKLN